MVSIKGLEVVHRLATEVAGLPHRQRKRSTPTAIIAAKPTLR